jgi:C4-dicarboxylate-specific signal transduction histidine kinase
MRRYIVSLLSENYRVVQTATGANVIDLVAEHEPRMALLDWMMPGKDGLSVCRELRGKYPDLKIVLLTARIDERSKLDALEAGADDFLTKPFSSVELRTRVANLLRSGRLQSDLRASNEELARTIEKLQRTEAMLIQSEKMNAIGSMSAGLLHEINNPLNYTLTAIGFAKRDPSLQTPDIQEVLSDVEEGMQRIRDVITHLKTFAYPEKPGAGSAVLLKEVVDSAAKLSAGEIEGVRLEIDLPEGMHVNGQRTQLTHVFINLLSNAGKALKDQPGPKVISVRATGEDEFAAIEVVDNGPGIPAGILNRIFEPFFTTRDVGAGMGLGLSICHTIVEAHGGSIRAENRPEGGASFTIQLPLAKEALDLC